MADVNRGNRPLSPHLQIYRPQMTSISSILMRISGNALIVAALMITWWFVAAAAGPDAFATADAFLTSWFGKLVFIGSIWAIWYHLLGGIRHLIWDTGRALDVATAEMMGWGMVVGSILLTLITIAIL
ncbi:MAG: succinate dehydrogenase, cytochrome b556 subunit [Jannaschia helgolandensis]|jgi:succinate dehydrogenase cytochrome b subunit|uniref:Succinate dehydrogenase cytochrome b556 subunit n=1 Tax=Jannaschia helgolandensis TaxID=188906 RepID=A0A1H7I422_9RHOB|nr:succinate dehydrogenase, cytochrome b556 subunit [Jannaschia helgolandensis]SEK57178.1 succinate dehydrogenase subunit C [Jannaschia helgolandensis]